MSREDGYRKAADFIRQAGGFRPQTAVVLGSGLGGFAQRVSDAVRIPYARIPGFPRATAPSHAGELLLGRVAGREVCVLSGRFHGYEGLSMRRAAFYVGALKLAGIRNLLLTNASGSVSAAFAPGDLMLIRDHINFSGRSPCRGRNIDALGPRFFDMSDAYSRELRRRALECAGRAGIAVKEGVYAYMPGPQFETPAEVLALRVLGADAVGMSTVPEVIEAAHCGIRVLGLSCITNYAAGLSDLPASGEEAIRVADRVSGTFGDLLERLINDLF